MELTEINNCPGTLTTGFQSYSPTLLKKMFDGKKVSHILDYTPGDDQSEDLDLFNENRRRISISGVQQKVSLVLEKNKLRLSKPGEQGRYILKPIPKDIRLANQIPANEHLSMQLANQVFGIKTAMNALIFFKNGEPAYITRRFDLKPDGLKWGTEDFASLAGKTSRNAGRYYKYEYSYEEMAVLMKKFVPAYPVEIEKFFSLILFNYLIANGDAHLKNFSLMETTAGDYIMSPAYDLINTRLHMRDADFALNKGLFNDGREISGKKDFREFGQALGMIPKRIDRILDFFTQKSALVKTLIDKSFLSSEMKMKYFDVIQSRIENLKN